MRSFVLLLLAALVALVLAPAALATSWVSRNLTDTGTYLSTIEPLSGDRDVQRLTAGVVAAAVQDRLPPEADVAAPAVRRATDQVVRSSAFTEVWRESNRGVHRDVVAVLEGERPTDVDELGRVRLDLTPLTASVADALERRGVPATGALDDVPVSVPVAEVDQLEQARSAYDQVDLLGWAAPVAWLVVVLLGVAVAARRWYAVAVMGVATALGAGLVLLGVVFGRELFAGTTDREELAGAVWDVVTQSLVTQSIVVAFVAVGVAAVGGVLQRVTDRRA